MDLSTSLDVVAKRKILALARNRILVIRSVPLILLPQFSIPDATLEI